jgi:hypothetical protein
VSEKQEARDETAQFGYTQCRSLREVRSETVLTPHLVMVEL